MWTVFSVQDPSLTSAYCVKKLPLAERWGSNYPKVALQGEPTFFLPLQL